MLTVVSGLLIFLGIMMMIYHIIVPVTVADWLSGTVTAYNISGLVLAITGLVILGVRLHQTGVGGLLDLPKEDSIQCFTQPGHSQNTRIINGKLMDNNIIKARGKLINYKGGGFRIAGHECIRVHGNVVPNIPEWLGETLARYKETYKVDDIYKLSALHKKLKGLDPKKPILEQLKKIPEIGNALDDPESVRQILSMPIKDLQQMAETLWDGTTVRLEPDIDEFIQTATPSQVHQYAQKEYMSLKNRDKMLKKEGTTEWAKYAIPIGILLFMAALGLGIFLQMGSS